MNAQYLDCSSTKIAVEDSARLIVDLAAAGAPLVADAVPLPIVDLVGQDLARQIELARHLQMTDPYERQKHSIALRRLVNGQHSTYANVETLRNVGKRPGTSEPSVSILLATNRPESIAFAFDQIARQNYGNFEVVCGLHGFELTKSERDAVGSEDYQVSFHHFDASHDFGELMDALAERSSGDLVAKWDDDDWYASEHLQDLVSAMRYSGADLVGKAAEFVYLHAHDLTIRRFSMGSERHSKTIAGGTMMTFRQHLEVIGGWPAGSRQIDRLLIERLEKYHGRVYRMHGFGYVLRRQSDPSRHTWTVEDGYFLEQSTDQRAGLDLPFAGVV